MTGNDIKKFVKSLRDDSTSFPYDALDESLDIIEQLQKDLESEQTSNNSKIELVKALYEGRVAELQAALKAMQVKIMNTFLIIAAILIFMGQLSQSVIIDSLKKKISDMEDDVKLIKANQVKSAEDELLKNPVFQKEEDFGGTYKDD